MWGQPPSCHAEHRNCHNAIRRVYRFRRDAAALATEDQSHWKYRHELLGANADVGLFGDDDPSASGFQFG
jgi:hypothetical protein